MAMLKANCLQLFLQYVREAWFFALARAGSKRAANMAMMAMTTNNSIKVNALPRGADGFVIFISFWTVVLNISLFGGFVIEHLRRKIEKSRHTDAAATAPSWRWRERALCWRIGLSCF
jgi:hypothetical protein